MVMGKSASKVALWAMGILGFVFTNSAIASSSDLRTTYRALSIGSKTLQFSLLRYSNEHKQTELAVLLNHKTPVLYARDLDGDGHLDAWFVAGREGIRDSFDIRANQKDGWDVASRLIRTEMDLTRFDFQDWLVSVASSPWLIVNTFSSTHFHQFFSSLTRKELDVQSLEIYASRHMKTGVAREGAMQEFELVRKSWDQIIHEIDRGKTLEGAALVGDGALWFVMRGVGSLIEKSYAWLASKIAQTEVGLSIGELAARFSLGAKRFSQKVAARLPALNLIRGAGKLSIEYGPRAWLAKLSFKSQVNLYLDSLTARGKLGFWAANSINAARKTIGTGLREIKYVGITQSIQFVTESYGHRKELFKDGLNPIVVAKNYANNHELIQDMAFMTNETFWMSAFSSPSASRSLSSKIRLCGILAFVDSTSMNLAIKHEMDPGRNAMDTGWEMIAGNLQTQIDMKSLGYFEALSVKTSNPKLKLIGYLLAAVDQAAGYIAYEKVSHSYETSKKPNEKENLILVPILKENGIP